MFNSKSSKVTGFGYRWFILPADGTRSVPATMDYIGAVVRACRYRSMCDQLSRFPSLQRLQIQIEDANGEQAETDHRIDIEEGDPRS